MGFNTERGKELRDDQREEKLQEYSPFFVKQNVGLLYIFYTNYVSENLALVRAKNSVLKLIRGAKRVEKMC